MVGWWEWCARARARARARVSFSLHRAFRRCGGVFFIQCLFVWFCLLLACLNYLVGCFLFPVESVRVCVCVMSRVRLHVYLFLYTAVVWCPFVFFTVVFRRWFSLFNVFCLVFLLLACFYLVGCFFPVESCDDVLLSRIPLSMRVSMFFFQEK